MNYLYKHYDKKGNLLYVGITKNVKKRQRSHARKSEWFFLVERICVHAAMSSRDEIHRLEILTIMIEEPIFNNRHSSLDSRNSRISLMSDSRFIEYKTKLISTGFARDINFLIEDYPDSTEWCVQPERTKTNRYLPKFKANERLLTENVHNSNYHSHLESGKPVPKKPLLFRKYVLEVLTAIVVVVVYSWHIYLLVAY